MNMQGKLLNYKSFSRLAIILASDRTKALYPVAKSHTLFGARFATYCTNATPAPDIESTNLYARLGLKKDAQSAEIKQRFFELSKVHHPDVGGDTNKFRKIKESYEILSRADKRRMYDAGLLSPDGRFTSGHFLVHFVLTAML